MSSLLPTVPKQHAKASRTGDNTMGLSHLAKENMPEIHSSLSHIILLST
jgi:hypothetical protein